MMKFFIKNCLFLIIYFLFLNFVSSDYIICDSGNIDYSEKTLSGICNGGYETYDITKIETFTGNFINMNLGYLGNDFLNSNLVNFQGELPLGFFDNNKSTYIEKNNIIYSYPVGYLSQNDGFKKEYNNLEKITIGFFNEIMNTKIIQENPEENFLVGYFGQSEIAKKSVNLDLEVPIGFFDNIRSTDIEKKDVNYNLPVGYFGNIVFPKKGGVNKNNTIKKYTAKEFYMYIFKKYSNNDYVNNGYLYYEYEEFINNIVNLLVDIGYPKGNTPIISETSQKRIELYIKNTDFQDKLSLLMKNLREINSGFNDTDSDEEKVYMINYYLE